MLYQALRLVTGVALRWHYREVAAMHADRIPRDRPILLAVNHPNALVDALVIGWTVPRPVRITAKAVLFDNPVLGAFLRAMGVIPLRRASDELARRRGGLATAPVAGTPDPRRNSEAFQSILEALDANGAVLIFPEGKSHDAPALEPLRTGPARIALAAADAGRAPGLCVVPVGLVFEEKQRVRSRVLAVVGDPIDVHAWAAAAEPEQRTESLTRQIERRMRSVMLEAPSVDQLHELRALAALVTEVVASDAPPLGADRSLAEEYVVAARLTRGFAALDQLPPDVRTAAEDTLARIERFRQSLEQADIAPADAAISLRKRHGFRFAIREVALLLVVGPVAAWGRINHWLPFRGARALATRNVSANDQPAMRTIVSGLGLVLLAYAVQAGVVAALTTWWAGAAYLVTLPFAADVDLRYSDRLGSAVRRMRTYRRLRRDPAHADQLQRERAGLATAIRRVDGLFREWELRGAPAE